MNLMAPSVASATSSAHLLSLDDVRPHPAKVDLRIRETGRKRAGMCVSRALAIAGLSIKEGAAILDMDPAQLSRWISGAESVQVHRILDCRQLHGPFVIAFASEADGIDVDTVITVRRTA
jgi:hypothetical protein